MPIALAGLKKSFDMSSDIFIATILKNSLALLLLVACLGKIHGFALFKKNLVDSFKLPSALTTPLASFIVFIEFTLATSLLMGSAQLISFSLYAAFTLILVFSLVVAQKLLTYQNVACNCFGATKQNLTWLDLLRNFVLLLCCIITSRHYQPLQLSGWDLIAAYIMTVGIVIFLLNFKDITKIVFSNSK